MKHKRRTMLDVVEEVRALQRNVIWPDTLRNSRNIDAFLWFGSPKATLVQRIGAMVIGAFFLSIGIAGLLIAHDRHSFVELVVGLLVCAIGARITLRAFRGGTPKQTTRL